MVELNGEVFTGEGKAAKFLQMKEYKRFLTGLLDGEPFPGTLNLRVNEDKLSRLTSSTNSERLNGFENENGNFGGITFHRVSIEGREAGLLKIDKTSHGSDVAEIVATQNLRQTLNLEDGDEVKVTDDF